MVALYSNTTGDANTAIGLLALQSNTTASDNTAIGLQALYGNTTGGSNTAIGEFCAPNQYYRRWQYGHRHCCAL